MDKRIPVLTDVVAEPGEHATAAGRLMTDEELSELQTRLATEGFHLMERLLREAFREMELNLMAEVISRLRQELPEIVDDVLREHFASGQGATAAPGRGNVEGSR